MNYLQAYNISNYKINYINNYNTYCVVNTTTNYKNSYNNSDIRNYKGNDVMRDCYFVEVNGNRSNKIYRNTVALRTYERAIKNEKNCVRLIHSSSIGERVEKWNGTKLLNA